MALWDVRAYVPSSITTHLKVRWDTLHAHDDFIPSMNLALHKICVLIQRIKLVLNGAPSAVGYFVKEETLGFAPSAIPHDDVF